MNRKIIIFTGSFVLMILSVFTANCQGITSEEYKSIDSVQKIMMEDSLYINHTLVLKVFAIRDSYFKKVDQVRLDSQLSEQQQNSEVKILRKQNVERIKDLLGTDLFDKYVELIKNRIRKSSAIGNALTDDSGANY